MCGECEILPGCPAAQNPFPPPPRPLAPRAIHGPPGLLPTHRQGSFMAPGRSRRNKIQLVSKVADCEGPGALP